MGGIQTFKKRAAEIADHAHNPTGAIGGGSGDFLKGLDENERHRESIIIPLREGLAERFAVFRTAHESAKAIKQFLVDRNTSKK